MAAGAVPRAAPGAGPAQRLLRALGDLEFDVTDALWSLAGSELAQLMTQLERVRRSCEATRSRCSMTPCPAVRPVVRPRASTLVWRRGPGPQPRARTPRWGAGTRWT